MKFLKQHPKVHKFVDWLASFVAFVLSTQDQLVAQLHIFPAGSSIPRFVGYALATLSFSDILLKKMKDEPDSAAPNAETPSSSAITTVEKIDPKKSI